MDITIMTREEATEIGRRWAEERERNRKRWIDETLAEWPKHLHEIAKVLFDVEDNLSDGYDYYAGFDDISVRAELREIVERLYRAAVTDATQKG